MWHIAPNAMEISQLLCRYNIMLLLHNNITPLAVGPPVPEEAVFMIL